jgi:mannosyltransferase
VVRVTVRSPEDLRDRASDRPTGPPGRAARARGWVPSSAAAATLAVLGSALVAQRQSLWYDELYTARVGTAGLGALARAVLDGTGTTSYLADVPPSYNAPYYVVVHLWLALTRLPADGVGLRLLSLLAAVAAVAVLARAAQRLAGPAVGLAAGLLAATSPLVVEYSAEARGYGLALLATATAVLGLARWLDGAPRGLLLYGAGAALTGLAHWFALPVVGGLALAALLLRRRAALPLLAVSAVAALPALALMALLVVNGTGTSAVGWIRPTERPVPVLALEAWAGGSVALLLALVAAATLALARSGRNRPAAAVAAAWLAVPLLAIWLADAVRPVFVPRYLLPALLGTALLTAVGAAGGRWRVPLTAGLVGLSLLAVVPLLDRAPREDARGAVAALSTVHAPGVPVVAVDPRAALALEHYGSVELRRDLRVPPDDPPPGADVVWLLRQSTGATARPSDDDDLLRAEGLRVVDERVFEGTGSDLLLQRWER